MRQLLALLRRQLNAKQTLYVTLQVIAWKDSIRNNLHVLGLVARDVKLYSMPYLVVWGGFERKLPCL